MPKKSLPVEGNSFSEIDKVISKEFNDLIDLSKVDTRVKTWFDIGVYSLNYICSKSLFGGIPSGRVTSIDGTPGVGKSLLTASIMRDPKIDYILIIETEGGGNSAELLQFAGVDPKKVRLFKANTFENYRIKKKDSSIEEVNDNKFPKTKDTAEYIYHEGATRFIRRFIDAVEFNDIRKNILVVMDSLGNLTSVRDYSGTPDMGAKGKAINSFFRNFDISFERTNIVFVFTNKLYTNIGNQWEPYKVSGGVGVEYNPSLSIRLSNTSESDDLTEAYTKDERDRRKTALGSSVKTIRAKVEKSRFGTEYRQIPFLVDFSSGVVRYSGLFSLCKDFGIIKKNNGSTYTMEGILDKSFYRKDFIKLVSSKPELLNSIQEKLEEKERLIKEQGSFAIEIEDTSEEFDDEDYHEMKKEMEGALM